jgi:protein-tyrosine phosphatase
MRFQDPTAFEIDFDPLSRRMRGIAVHGNTPFDVPFMSEIAENLWTGGCEDGLILPINIEHLVSLYKWESYTIYHDLRTQLVVTAYDAHEVDGDQIKALASWVNVCRKTGPVLLHCQAGLNRSNLVAAAALIIEGMDAPEAIALLREKRSPAVLCNPTFESWLREAL